MQIESKSKLLRGKAQPNSAKSQETKRLNTGGPSSKPQIIDDFSQLDDQSDMGVTLVQSDLSHDIEEEMKASDDVKSIIGVKV